MWLTGAGRVAVLAYGLSFVMGLQNAVVTRISNARVQTTHVTGMVTDIGIELGNLLDLALRATERHRRRDGRDLEAEYNADKLRLHAKTVLSFLAGCVFGVLAYRRLGAMFLFGGALLLFLLALRGMVRRSAGPQRRQAEE